DRFTAMILVKSFHLSLQELKVCGCSYKIPFTPMRFYFFCIIVTEGVQIEPIESTNEICRLLIQYINGDEKEKERILIKIYNFHLKNQIKSKPLKKHVFDYFRSKYFKMEIIELPEDPKKRENILHNIDIIIMDNSIIYIWMKLKSIHRFIANCKCCLRNTDCVKNNKKIFMPKILKPNLKKKFRSINERRYLDRYPEQSVLAWFIKGKEQYYFDNISSSFIKRVYLKFNEETHRPYIVFGVEEKYKIFYEWRKTKSFKDEFNGFPSYSKALLWLKENIVDEGFYQLVSDEMKKSGLIKTKDNTEIGILLPVLFDYENIFNDIVNKKINEKSKIIPKIFRDFNDNIFAEKIKKTLEEIFYDNTPMTKRLDLWGFKDSEKHNLYRFAKFRPAENFGKINFSTLQNNFYAIATTFNREG
ncbi:MAG: hypothetical protein HOC71_02560, partial [Candidatus Latescibacteria bacterium]|nr:hypothetical protein [Candidatus Latescibacterota bacterium]